MTQTNWAPAFAGEHQSKASRASFAISGFASGGVTGQAASSASATAVRAAIRAAFLLLPSIAVQGPQRVFVHSNISRAAAR